MSTDKQDDKYLKLRRKHIKLGGIAAGAETLARDGDHAGAIAWLKHANKHSDFIHRPGGAR
jgi:hypothetical protein